MSSEDEPRRTDSGMVLPTLEELLSDSDHRSEYIPDIDFEEKYEDPVESDHTDLDAVPERAVIDFDNGVVRDCSMVFIIKRAMVDPDAKVLPDGSA